MFCTKCGTKNDNGDEFCGECGAKLKETKTNQVQQIYTSQQVANEPMESLQPSNEGRNTPNVPSKRENKGLLIGVIAAVIVIATGIITMYLLLKTGTRIVTNSSSVVSIKEASFSTPEEAIKHFISSVSANDLYGALTVCAINENAQNYDAKAFINRIENISLNMPAPSQYKFYKAINQSYFLNQIVFQIRNFTYSFSESDAVKSVIGGSPYSTANDVTAADEFVKAVDPNNIKALTVVRIDKPYPEILNEAQAIKNFKIQAKVYGADDGTERVVLYKINGKYYKGGFTLYRYSKNWKIVYLNSVFAGMDISGAAIETTKEDYVNLLK